MRIIANPPLKGWATRLEGMGHPVKGRPLLFHADDFGDFGDVVLEGLFDAHLQCDGGRGAADAGAVEPDGHEAGLIDIDELDIAAIALNGGAELPDDIGDTIFHFVGGLGHLYFPCRAALRELFERLYHGRSDLGNGEGRVLRPA